MEYIGNRERRLGEKGVKRSTLHSSPNGVPIPNPRNNENSGFIMEIVKKELKIKSWFENI